MANVCYLEGERLRSAEARRDLLRERGLTAPRTAEEAIDLIALAVEVFAPDEGFRGRLIQHSGSELRIVNRECPTYSLVEAQNWHGVTACASWHRRRGWFDALGVAASDSVLFERKWGDPACVCLLRVEAVGALR
ncbi:MAG: hypothetical protein EXR65_04990 [Dehalococcoidia bacterium]|nr:hypothetical protein [Dehalococcoidia bacterium]